MNDAEVSDGGALVGVMVGTSVGGGKINLSALFMRSKQNKELPASSRPTVASGPRVCVRVDDPH